MTGRDRAEGRGWRVERLRTLPFALYPPPSWSIALLALLSSATSLVNGFVYDDGPIVASNPRVHTLARAWEVFVQPYWPAGWGDGNYRPLTILSFAVQWAVGDGSPAVFHATSVALYVAACLAVLALARLVLPQAAAWLVAALFAVHPVHVEAVGNVVGQAEIVVTLCSTLAVATYVRRRTARPPRLTDGVWLGDQRFAAKIAALYVVACLSKETGFFLPALLVAAELTVVGAQLGPGRRSLRARFAEAWPAYAACGAIAAAYLAARHSVLDGLGDDPHPVTALLSHKARALTMLGVVPEWVRLLVWPARLAADYSPPDVRIFPTFSSELVPAVAILLGCAALCVAGWRGRRVAAFGLAWAAVALFPVSNLVLRSGVIVAERTLFLPSVGALLAIGAGVAWVNARWGAPRGLWVRVAAAGAAALLTLGVVKSAGRQRVWRSADDFYERIVEDAPLGYRAHYLHGMWLIEKGRRAEGERHVRAAIALFPYDAAPYIDLADEYRKAGLCAPARELYRRAVAIGSSRAAPRLGLVACLLHDGELEAAKAEAERGVERGGADAAQFRRLLGIADSAMAARRPGVTLSGAPRRRQNRAVPRH